jgi:UDPglucose 6-dehydrogenase
MRVAVVGTGYVGLVAGAGFADFGNDVICADADAAKIAALSRGDVPLFEPGLPDLLRRNLREGRLHFTTDAAGAAGASEIVFLAVGTPSAPDGGADTGQVEAAAEAVARGARGALVVAIKSTVPVGTCDRVAEILRRGAPSVDFAVASNPEFLKEGDAVNDFLRPERIVIGTGDERARRMLRDLYAPFMRLSERVVLMDARSAELCKYACNAMLATRVSFMNELAALCERVGADVEEVRQGMARDARIGARFLFPGAGMGGSCLPKDLRALCAIGRAAGSPLEIVEATARVNERQKTMLAERIVAHFGGDLRKRVVAIWGLAFKPRTDDVREAPALAIIERLLAAGARVRAHDPAALDAARALLGDRIEYSESAYAAVAGADALCVVTEWPEFRRPDFARILAEMRTPALFDGRDVWDPEATRALGFSYYGIGRS